MHSYSITMKPSVSLLLIFIPLISNLVQTWKCHLYYGQLSFYCTVSGVLVFSKWTGCAAVGLKVALERNKSCAMDGNTLTSSRLEASYIQLHVLIQNGEIVPEDLFQYGINDSSLSVCVCVCAFGYELSCPQSLPLLGLLLFRGNRLMRDCLGETL